MKHLLFIFQLTLFFTSNVAAQCVHVSDWQKIIPEDNLPLEVKTRNANNNLDIIQFKDRYYVAFRTAPSHFASSKAAIYIVSTTDFQNWQFEKHIYLKSDVREPRLYKNDDTLFFMFFKGGKNMFKFQPNGIFQTHFFADKWTEVSELKLPLGYVPWRTKYHEGLFYLSTYDGSAEYKLSEPAESRFFVSKDGYKWDSLSLYPQQYHVRAVAENEFVFLPNGDMWGIARHEFDGASLFYAKKEALADWKLWFSKHKFDSPYLFSHHGVPYLIARRNLDGDGTYYRKKEKYKSNLVRYSFTKKTTALYAIDTTSKALIHIMDLNSTGDCAFAGVAPINDSSYVVLNYSSDINKKSKNWIEGQLGKTFIYKATLTLRNCGVDELDKKRVFLFE